MLALAGGGMNAKRKDDLETQARYRTERTIKHNGKWFFCTREGTIQGPFLDQFEANYQLKIYIDSRASELAGELSLEPLEPVG